MELVLYLRTDWSVLVVHVLTQQQLLPLMKLAATFSTLAARTALHLVCWGRRRGCGGCSLLVAPGLRRRRLSLVATTFPLEDTHGGWELLVVHGDLIFVIATPGPPLKKEPN